MFETIDSISDRSKLPLNGPGPYKVLDGKIHTRSIEVNAVDHCNLSCRSCSHASPTLETREMSSEQVKSDLSALARFMRVENVRIVGGEPLMHTNLPSFAESILNSGITDRITLVTNGLLLMRTSDLLWEFIDEVNVSLYPLASVVVDRIQRAAENLNRRGVHVAVLKYSYFREAVSVEESADRTLVSRIYNTCQIAHFWRCITVDRGRIYRCPQSLHRVRVRPDFEEEDSIQIATIENMNHLLKFLESPEPLNACFSCLGSGGRIVKHEQVSRKRWLEHLSRRPEDAVDRVFLSQLDDFPRSSNGCMTRHPL